MPSGEISAPARRAKDFLKALLGFEFLDDNSQGWFDNGRRNDSGPLCAALLPAGRILLCFHLIFKDAQGYLAHGTAGFGMVAIAYPHFCA